MVSNFCCYCMNDINGEFPCRFCKCEGDFQTDRNHVPLRTVLDDRFLIGRSLGSGGFGITYLGYDLGKKDRVAIKEYFPEHFAVRDSDSTSVTPLNGRDAEYNYHEWLNAFRNEAKILRSFKHPNIIEVRSVFNENNTSYFDMPYVEGNNLKDYVKKLCGNFSENELVDIIIPILEGLKFIHRRSLLHLDIKPSNIYIPENKNIPPLLLDFGSARKVIANPDQEDVYVPVTYGYAPLEQDRSMGELGVYTDIYACAATMYACLGLYDKETGKLDPPIAAKDRANGVYFPDILSITPNDKVSPILANAIMAGLELEKQNRPQNADEFQRMIIESQNFFTKQKQIAERPKKKNRDVKEKIDKNTPDPSALPGTYFLKIIEGEKKGQRLEVTPIPAIIGRSKKYSKYEFSSDIISRQHCQVFIGGNGLVQVQDLGSTHGTWVNDKKLQAFEIVEHQLNAELCIAGIIHFQVEYPEVEKKEENGHRINIQMMPAKLSIRFGSLLIDLVLLSVFVFIFRPFFSSSPLQFILFWFALQCLYFSIFEGSRTMGTLGKRLCGLIVTDLNSQQIGFGTSLLRNILFVLPLILYIAYIVIDNNEWQILTICVIILYLISAIMAGASKNYQTFHDYFSRTKVFKINETPILQEVE